MISEQKQKMLDLYNQGMNHYKERNWSKAKDFFSQALTVVPNDGPSKLYVYRCEQYEKTSPPADWNGVFIMTTK